MRRLLVVLSLGLGALFAAPAALAQHEPPPTVAPPHAQPPAHDDHTGHGHGPGDGHGHAAAPDAHGAVATSHGAGHGAHGDEHVPSFDDFNWYYGLLAEKEDVEPGLLFRPKGMPVPFAGLLINTLILYYILYRAFGKPVRDGLKKRKETILRGMEEAAKMRREAEAQLASYEEKLAQVSDDIARIKEQARQASDSERARILSEAKERRERMERDAQLLVEQDLKAVREQLLAELTDKALKSAEETLKQRIGEGEQQRFADDYLRSLPAAAGMLRGRV